MASAQAALLVGLLEPVHAEHDPRVGGHLVEDALGPRRHAHAQRHGHHDRGAAGSANPDHVFLLGIPGFNP